MQPFSSATWESGTIHRPDPPHGLSGFSPVSRERGFRGPYRQSGMSLAEAHYL